MEKLQKEFLESSVNYFWQNCSRIEKCFSELSEEEIWEHPNGSTNSIANLTLHLCGNITQYIISTLGNNKDLRDRDGEFSADKNFTKAELLHKLKEVTKNAAAVAEGLSREQLSAQYSVQGFQKSGVAIVVHVTEHYSYHTGQIVLHTKILKDIDTGFYKGIDLNKKNT